MATTVCDIAAKNTTFFLESDRYHVCVCGRNEYNQMGLSVFSGASSLSNPTEIPVVVNITKIFPGEHHTFFLTDDGKAYAVGDNTYGQLGVNSLELRVDEPTQVTLSIDIENISFAGCYSLFKLVDGTVAIAGASPLENKIRNIPVVESNLGNLLINDQDSLIVTENEYPVKVKTMGANLYGELSNMTMYTKSTLTYIPEYSGMDNIVKVVAGGEHVLYLTKEGNVYASGSNDKYQLGFVSITTTVSTPSIVNTSNIVDIAAGYDHSLFLDDKGNLYGCGSNGYGQLGLGDKEYIQKPTKIASNVLTMRCGDFYTFVIYKNGTIYATGYNKDGQLGIKNDTNNRNKLTKLKLFTFDITLDQVGLPDDIDVECIVGDIYHLIQIIFSNIGNGNVKIESFIYTPSYSNGTVDERKKVGNDIILSFNASNEDSVKETCLNRANTRIRELKDYINNKTIYHREPIRNTKTVIYFTDGSYIEREGELMEIQAKIEAQSYLLNKYHVDTHLEYYDDTSFNNVKVVGEPTWIPRKGGKRYIISEIDTGVYNYY